MPEGPKQQSSRMVAPALLTVVLTTVAAVGCSESPTTSPVSSRVEAGIEQAENSVLLNPPTTSLQIGDSLVLWARTVEDGRGIPAASPTWRVSNANVLLRTLTPVAGGDWIRVAVVGTVVGPTTAIASYKQLADTIEIVVTPRRIDRD